MAMKGVAFVAGLCIAVVGAVGVLMPSSLVWIAQHFVTPEAFYGLAAVRVAFGLVLVSAAPVSRGPKALRVLGYVIVIAGIATALAGGRGIGPARASIEWWLRQGPVVIRVTGLPVLALGAFVAYACAPVRRDAVRRDEHAQGED
jgi:hypothetical protein